jgi:hypothetical protein
MSIPWYYVYSQRYEALHHMMTKTVTDKAFTLKPLFVEQSEFNKTIYKEGTSHFLTGCFIRQDLMLRILKESPLGSYFLFTDCDIVVLNQNGLFDFFKEYMDRNVDMVYMWENTGKEGVRNCNVGFALIRVTHETIAYFESVMRNAANCVDKTDLEIMDPLFSEFPGTIELFDRKVICLSNYFGETEPKSEIKIVQVLCSNTKDYRVNMREKYYGIQMFGLPIEEYLQMALMQGRTMDELGLS